MPEGDTIFRTARTLRQALVGRTVIAAATSLPGLQVRQPERLVGRTVADVEPRGKHLLCWFAPGDLALHTHHGMAGSWHLYRPGQRWRKPARLAGFRLDVDRWVAVCFTPKLCALLSAAEVARHPMLASLGPDALAAVTDLTEARRRLDARAGWTVGEALLDQRVLAGVGNVYKNEVLFIHEVNPWTSVDALPGALRDGLLVTATNLLKANVGPGTAARVTTAGIMPPRTGARTRNLRGDRLHVYGRAGRPCPRCGTPIRVAAQGAHARLTYWCTRCQGPGPR